MYERVATDNSDPGRIGFAPSTALEFHAGMRPEVWISGPNGFQKEIALPAAEFLPFSSQQSPNLLYLGGLREWARAGKPEIYFLACSKLSLDDHLNILNGPQRREGHSKHIPSQAVCTDPDLYRLSDRQDPDRCLRTHRNLLERTDKLRLQQAAVGGLYLLYNAYDLAVKEGDRILLDYMAQIPNTRRQGS